MRRISLFSLLCIMLLCGCEDETPEPEDAEDDIDYVEIDQEVSLTMDYDESNTEDRIQIDITQDGNIDFIFAVRDLRDHDGDYSEFDSPLAAVVYPQDENEVLDDSGYGYLTTLDDGASVDGEWSNASDDHTVRFILGTIGSPTAFPGAGPKFMGIKIKSENGDLLTGWIQLEISEDRDHIHVIDAAYQLVPELSINAGQIE